MIAEIVAAVTFIDDVMDEHPDLARMVSRQIRKLVGAGAPEHASVEAQRGLAAGIAAARANAVQEYVRRQRARFPPG